MAIKLLATSTWVNPSSQAKSCGMEFTTSGSLEFVALRGKRVTALWLIEADAWSEAPMEELVARLNNPSADRPVRWLGFSNGAMRGCIRSLTHCKKQLQGSQCIVFKGASLKPTHDSSLESMRYSHFDLKVWRSFNKTRCGFPEYPSSEFVATYLPLWVAVSSNSVKASMMLRSVADRATKAHTYVLLRSKQTWISQQLTCSLD